MKCPNCGQETDDIICSCGYQFTQGTPPAPKQSWLSKTLSESRKKTEQEKQAYQKWQQEQRALKSGKSLQPTVPVQELTPEQLDLQMKAAQLKMQSEQLELQRKQLELQQAQMQGMMRCPKCGSTSLSGNKKGFGIGKAVVGAYVAGPIGLVAGNLGAKKVRVTCLRCGHKFWAGKG